MNLPPKPPSKTSPAPGLAGDPLEGHLAAQELLGALQAAEEIYLRLIELGRNQSRLLQGGYSEELLELAKRKESEMARLSYLESGMRRARSKWDSLQSSLPETEREPVQKMLARVEKTLRELLQLEEESSRLLLQQRDQILGQIQRLHAARKFQKAYFSPLLPHCQAIDQKE
ncbi:MAG: hypothetical protein HY717_09790 [Planctomycetes bacterium]|nr:hypothetical protein [Planctomycetota bacterium]